MIKLTPILFSEQLIYMSCFPQFGTMLICVSFQFLGFLEDIEVG